MAPWVPSWGALDASTCMEQWEVNVGSKRQGELRSRLGGLPVTLPPASEPSRSIRQLTLSIGDDARAPVPLEVFPGVIHIPNWLGIEAQHRLTQEFRVWALPPAGLRHPRMPTGHLMTVQTVCLGWHWFPYVYSRTADDTDGAPVKPPPTR